MSMSQQRESQGLAQCSFMASAPSMEVFMAKFNGVFSTLAYWKVSLPMALGSERDYL